MHRPPTRPHERRRSKLLYSLDWTRFPGSSFPVPGLVPPCGRLSPSGDGSEAFAPVSASRLEPGTIGTQPGTWDVAPGTVPNTSSEFRVYKGLASRLSDGIFPGEVAFVVLSSSRRKPGRAGVSRPRHRGMTLQTSRAGEPLMSTSGAESRAAPVRSSSPLPPLDARGIVAPSHNLP
jgi:hypothetical protein